MQEEVLAVIQARTGSTRLPGKVMYPLAGQPALKHVVTRTTHADSITNVVVATSTGAQDDVIAQYAPTFGAEVIRGSESNVLSRFEDAIDTHNPNIVLRITGDCPLIDPTTIDRVVAPVRDDNTDYASNITHRTFPRGLDVEAFTTESFERVASAATTQAEREHVTPYYRENPDEFNIANITSEQVFDNDRYIDRTDLRLTLDEAADYQLLNQLYEKIEYDKILSIRDASDLIDTEGLTEINESVRQKKV